MIHKKQKSLKLNQKDSKFFGQLYIKKFIKDITGLLPYEKKIYENLMLGKDKKALRIGTKKLGNIKRSKKKKGFDKFFSP
mmetsp:Transcript_45245/g.110170  ORF Transcript_45245/g.110170 Transcript_45245/m.110170 type:complete len:80 (-) Transcript_45245:304-543(-)